MKSTAIGVLALVLTACSPEPRAVRPGDPLARTGDEIVVGGRFVHTGAPVVLWIDPGGYDAYRVECKFDPGSALATGAGAETTPNRYGTLRKHLPEAVARRVRLEGWDVDLLGEYVHQFVLHYDVAGTSRRCFQVLHDRRGLSVHFLLDLDGTIYQTLDVKERAWHAGTANDRSVGVEIAQIGAYAERTPELAAWYVDDGTGRPRIALPGSLGDGGLRTPGFVARPARDEPVHGPIHGRDLWQYDFTPEQYESLARLAAALGRVLPGIAPDAPRDPQGRVRTDALSPAELAAFRGILGHYHVTEKKVDPGPAFDWERFLARVRELREGE